MTYHEQLIRTFKTINGEMNLEGVPCQFHDEATISSPGEARLFEEWTKPYNDTGRDYEARINGLPGPIHLSICTVDVTGPHG